MTYQLDEPFFEDKRIITSKKEIGYNKTQMTFTSNGTIKGNIEVTNSGDLVSMYKGNKGVSAHGQGVLTTKDGSEKANYTLLQVSAVWNTDSTGNLAFLDNMLSFLIIEKDEMGNFSSKDRELK
jgi:hypothetical protein